MFCHLTSFVSIHAIEKKVKSLSRVRLFATPRTAAYQAPPSLGFSRQEYWSWVPLPSPGDLPDPGIKPGSPAFQADSLTSEHKLNEDLTGADPQSASTLKRSLS